MNKNIINEVCSVFNNLDFAISDEDMEKVYQYVLRRKIAEQMYSNLDINIQEDVEKARKTIDTLAKEYLQ